MALADARTMVPGLTVVAADEAADLQLLETIADWCDRFTPFVALVSPHALLLDVTGAAHLFGGERVLLDLVRASLKKQGFIVQGALAGTAAAARALAQERDGVIAAPGEEAVVVAPLPIATLALAPAVTHALRRAGLKTIGQVAGRLRAELVARFGSEVVTTIDRTLGKAEQPISPRVPLPDYMAEHRFAEPLTSEAAITGTLRGLANRSCVCSKNAVKAHACSRPVSSVPTARFAASSSKRQSQPAIPQSSNGCFAKSSTRSLIRSIPVSASISSVFLPIVPNMLLPKRSASMSTARMTRKSLF